MLKIQTNCWQQWGSMLKAQISNKGIQWRLSNPNLLGIEVFQPSEMFTWMKN